jgi:hypothetical protein
MNSESLRLLEQYLSGQLSPDEARSAEQVLARGAQEAGQGEELAVFAFLKQMGPAQPPPGLVARTCARLRAEVMPSQEAMPTEPSRIGALAWSYRGPALALGVPWTGHATRYAVQGLSMTRFALGPLGLAPRGLVSRGMTSLGLSRTRPPKPRTSAWRRVLGAVRWP